VVKLVDAGDSKSPDSCSHVGSIPTSGTNNRSEIKELEIYCLTPFLFLFWRLCPKLCLFVPGDKFTVFVKQALKSVSQTML
jgi:hypothetical protein